jgi:hypothetical protein
MMDGGLLVGLLKGNGRPRRVTFRIYDLLYHFLCFFRVKESRAVMSRGGPANH